VKGTIGILESILKHGQNVKRVVVTSSTAAVTRAVSSPTVFSEADWNDLAVKEVEDKGRAAPDPVKYLASKTLAEKGVLLFCQYIHHS